MNGKGLDAGKGKQRSWSYVMGQVKGNGLAELAVVMKMLNTLMSCSVILSLAMKVDDM